MLEYEKEFREEHREELAEYQREHRAEHGDEINAARRAKHAAFRAENPLPPPKTEDEIAATKAAWLKKDREENPDKYKDKSAREYQADRENILARQAIRRDEKGDELRAKAKAVRQEFPGRHRAANKAYRDANPGKGAARRANYLAALKKRTPVWSDIEVIDFFYVCRPEGFDVDHIAPLQGEIISGLHVVENLQWLPERVNKAKGNYWDCDERTMADYMRRLIRDNR